MALHREYLEAVAAVSPGLDVWDRGFPARKVFGYNAEDGGARLDAAPMPELDGADEAQKPEASATNPPTPTTAGQADGTIASAGSLEAPTLSHKVKSATTVATIPIAWWTLLARRRGARNGVLRAAEWGGTAGIVHYLTPIIWRIYTGDGDCPEAFYEVMREAITPKAPDAAPRRASGNTAAASRRDRAALVAFNPTSSAPRS